MSRLIDLTGQRFGMLTVLCRSKQPHPCVYWICRCDCGRIIEAAAANLTRGHTVSCGCRRVSPYIGKRYGELTVLEKNGETVQHGSTRSPLWKCRCSCGKIVLLRLDSLTSGTVRSCGCRKNEGKIQKMREAAGFVDGTQVSRILKIMEYNSTASAEEMIGVNYDPKSRRWQAALTFQGVRHRLGSYTCAAQAAAARKRAERERFGRFLDTLENSGKIRE